MEQAERRKISLTKRIAGILCIGAVLAAGVWLSQGLGKEIPVALFNESRAEISDIELRWSGGRLWWARLAPGEIREARILVVDVTGMKLSFSDSLGVPQSFEQAKILSPDLSGKLEVRVQEDGRSLFRFRASSP